MLPYPTYPFLPCLSFPTLSILSYLVYPFLPGISFHTWHILSYLAYPFLPGLSLPTCPLLSYLASPFLPGLSFPTWSLLSYLSYLLQPQHIFFCSLSLHFNCHPHINRLPLHSALFTIGAVCQCVCHRQ